MTEDIVETMKRFAFGAEQQNARDAVSGLLAAADEITRLRAALAQRTAERDEARRLACVSEARYADERDNSDDLYCANEESIMRDARRIAIDRGWNCFDAKEGQP